MYINRRGEKSIFSCPKDSRISCIKLDTERVFFAFYKATKSFIKFVEWFIMEC